MDEEIFFIVFPYEIDGLLDGVDGRRDRRDFHFRGIVQDGMCQLHDRRRHRRRKEQRLLLGRQFRDNLFHIMDEAHIQHTVCFVKHKKSNFLEMHKPLRHEIQQPARRRDEDVYAALECFHLVMLGDTAEDNGMLEMSMSAIGSETFTDLDRQFPGGSQDERLDSLHRLSVFFSQIQELQDRKSKRSGLSCSGLGATKQIFSAEDDRDGFLLDGGGSGISFFFERFQNRFDKSEFFERHTDK